MSPDKCLIILYNRTRFGPFRVLSVTCQLIKTGFGFFLFSLPSLSNLVIKIVTPSLLPSSVLNRSLGYERKKQTKGPRQSMYIYVCVYEKKKQRRMKDFVKIQRSEIVLKDFIMSINHAAKIC